MITLVKEYINKQKLFLIEDKLILAISGGADSSYALHLACKHGLKIVALHVDNGWNSSIAVRNIFKLVNSLKVDYKSYVLPWKKYAKVQKAFLKASVPEADLIHCQLARNRTTFLLLIQEYRHYLRICCPDDMQQSEIFKSSLYHCLAAVNQR